MIQWNTITARLNACHCSVSCTQHSAVCCQYVGGAACCAAVVWHEPRIANSRGPQRNVPFGSQGTVTHECYQGHATQSGSTQCNIKLSSEWNVHERAILSLGAVRNGSAVLFRRRVNSCEHNSCLPKCDKLQMLSWL